MLKRFLKILKGEQGLASPSERTYFDELLADVQPLIAAELETCPGHDPWLLLVTGVLRRSMKNQWHHEIREPLLDASSPGRIPPPPPGSITDEFEAPKEITREFDALELPLDEDVELLEDSEVLEASRKEEKESGEDPTDEFQPEEGDRKRRITEEIDVRELKQAHYEAEKGIEEGDGLSARDPSVETSLEVLAEAPDPTLEVDRESLLNQVEEDLRPRLDLPEVLQAGRLFLDLLLANDELAPEHQLSASEVVHARDLLLGHFIEGTDFEQKARRLLTLVEEKFSNGNFSQSRLLLQLFQTDESTRINNDRNLYYEDMILRLGVPRRHRVEESLNGEFQRRARAAAGGEDRSEFLNFCTQSLFMKFFLCTRHPAVYEGWETTVAGCELPGGKEAFLDRIPAYRWREATDREGFSIHEQLHDHIRIESARRHVIAHLKTCYFVLRAVGDTGLESYLDPFFDWTQRVFDFNFTTILPELYRRSMSDPTPIEGVFLQIWEAHFKEVCVKVLEEADSASIDKAIDAAFQEIAMADVAEVPAGAYDLGGFVYDQLLSFDYPGAAFAFKVHRLT